MKKLFVIIFSFILLNNTLFAENTYFDDTSKYISGIKIESENFKEQVKSKHFQNHISDMEKSWKEVYEKRLNFMKDWRDSEISDAVKTTETLFYPFSGPDFLNAFIFFPNAKTYILFGLESVGNLPDISNFTEKQIESYLANLKKAVSDIFEKSYFFTKKMNSQLHKTQLDGVMPIIAFFLKSTNNNIKSIYILSFNEKGEMTETPYELKKEEITKDKKKNKEKEIKPLGVKFVFTNGNSTDERSVMYFSQDIGDNAFKIDSPLHKYFNTYSNFTTYIKSASYLLHYSFMKNIRNLILDKSKYFLEDDTGIPYKYFKTGWDLKFYGIYIKPVDTFKDGENLYQQDLKEYYEKNKKTIPQLPFNLGYHWGKKKNILIFGTKK